MTDDAAPKTAYELAMERLRRKDAEAGITPQVVTEAQKAAIAEIRNLYEARLAQLDVLHQGEVRGLFDPEARAAADEEYRREHARLTAERDAKIARARSNEG
jgi:hypothetical protein